MVITLISLSNYAVSGPWMWGNWVWEVLPKNSLFFSSSYLTNKQEHRFGPVPKLVERATKQLLIEDKCTANISVLARLLISRSIESH